MSYFMVQAMFEGRNLISTCLFMSALQDKLKKRHANHNWTFKQLYQDDKASIQEARILLDYEGSRIANNA